MKNVWLERYKKRENKKTQLTAFIQSILFRKFKGVGKWKRNTP